jgi:hypothetical protein
MFEQQRPVHGRERQAGAESDSGWHRGVTRRRDRNPTQGNSLKATQPRRTVAMSNNLTVLSSEADARNEESLDHATSDTPSRWSSRDFSSLPVYGSHSLMLWSAAGTNASTRRTCTCKDGARKRREPWGAWKATTAPDPRNRKILSKKAAHATQQGSATHSGWRKARASGRAVPVTHMRLLKTGHWARTSRWQSPAHGPSSCGAACTLAQRLSLRRRLSSVPTHAHNAGG